jgi:hypothetical protein
MKSLATQVKNARITTKEVFIHLRKNGELKRKQYRKYLKLQYHTAANTYQMLRSGEASFGNNPKNPYNTPVDEKLTMPLHLVKSEISTMSKSFDDTSFLAEAWHFYQYEMMKEADAHFAANPACGFISNTNTSATGNIKTNEDDGLTKNVSPTNPSKEYLPQTANQPQTTIAPVKTIQYNKHTKKCNSLSYQVLKWAQEGKLNLN